MEKNVDSRDLLPRHKGDFASAEALIASGYPAVASVLPQLLKWLRDCTWPIAAPIGNFLVSIPEAVAPHVWDVRQGNDQIWKYWCISRLISVMPSNVAEQFRGELTRLAERPTPDERSEELDEIARDALSNLCGPRP